MTKRKAVIIASNTMWYLKNFRLPLMLELRARSVSVVAVARADDSADALRAAGLRTLDLPMARKGMNPLGDLGTFARFVRVYRKERPAVVLHNTIKPVIYGSLAARATGVPCILNMVPGLGYVYADNTLGRVLLRRLVEALYRLALASSRTVFFQNRDDRDHFVGRRLVDATRAVVTNGSGVDLKHFAYTPPRRAEGECVFLFVGRLLKDKGVLEFLAAARRLHARVPAARFRLLGFLDEGNPSGISRADLDEHTVPGSIDYLGSATDVRPALRDADVVVLPSYREGVPKALLEAMAVGRPIVTTDAPGCREVVAPGVNGLLIPPRNAEALETAMASLVSDPGRREAMGRAGRTIAEERFDVRAVNAMILSAMNLASAERG